jgi:hypothetical protein
MEWKKEVSPEQLLLPFGGLLQGANKLCDEYAVGPRRIRVSALPDHYAKAYAASLGNTAPKLPDKHDSETERVTDVLQQSWDSHGAQHSEQHSLPLATYTDLTISRTVQFCTSPEMQLSHACHSS